MTTNSQTIAVLTQAKELLQAYSGPLIFSRLGLDVEQTFIPHQVALGSDCGNKRASPPYD